MGSALVGWPQPISTIRACPLLDRQVGLGAIGDGPTEFAHEGWHSALSPEDELHLVIVGVLTGQDDELTSDEEVQPFRESRLERPPRLFVGVHCIWGDPHLGSLPLTLGPHPAPSPLLTFCTASRHETERSVSRLASPIECRTRWRGAPGSAHAGADRRCSGWRTCQAPRSPPRGPECLAT